MHFVGYRSKRHMDFLYHGYNDSDHYPIEWCTWNHATLDTHSLELRSSTDLYNEKMIYDTHRSEKWIQARLLKMKRIASGLTSV